MGPQTNPDRSKGVLVVRGNTFIIIIIIIIITRGVGTTKHFTALKFPGKARSSFL